MSDKVSIYLLSEAETNVPMYVGKTSRATTHRLNQHLKGDTRATRKWVEDVKKRRAEIVLTTLETCSAKLADVYETVAIWMYVRKNPSLLNVKRPTNLQFYYSLLTMHRDKFNKELDWSDREIEVLMAWRVPEAVKYYSA